MKNLLILIFCLYASSLSAGTENKYNNEIECDSVYTYVEQMPQYSGGESEMFKFIFDNVVHPPLKDGEMPASHIKVRFIVRKTGKIENVEAIGKNKDTDLAKSLVKVIELMPNWYAGKQNGQLVDVYFTIPLTVCYR